MSRIMQHFIRPVAARSGIAIKGWLTLRHSYTTLLRQNDNDPKVVQGLLRWASPRNDERVRRGSGSGKANSTRRAAAKPVSTYRQTYRGRRHFCKCLILLASPTGFEPVLPP